MDFLSGRNPNKTLVKQNKGQSFSAQLTQIKTTQMGL